jgi:hypothetical protein
MKFLVSAFDAQSWADAGSKGGRAIRNGMRALTQPYRRHNGVIQDYSLGLNLYCGKSVYSVACLYNVLLAFTPSLFSETSLLRVTLPVAILVLFFIISIGVVFDIIGIAVTFQDNVAFAAMASKRIPGAKNAVKLVCSASLVSNICSDVVGDICGIVSGAMGAAISIRLLTRV